ncbi:Phosphatidylglycerophosphatase gep4 mitochondrial [Brettanomyces nanus]|uniref:Phosphatidylglycerophosphatase gep4 mitochondrial n=1 Tax=Eeniella nana TaxID=13502 RepID=A0A875RUE8_EENNA|nr:Phosphatidylglycerophosphatase gep4 mitochondrial [Brettanomyces nanus]QPG74497.1 Phosphatidylglycerophosphatase gep4 mitochondrial [Brettanomyces nanus]
MLGANLSGTLNTLRLLTRPELCIPHLAIPTFNDLPVPIVISGRGPIKAVVLDKDNCFAKPYENRVWPQYADKWTQLTRCYPGSRLLIVSNTAGTEDDKDYKQAKVIELNTGIPVLRHSTKKPGCWNEIIMYFKQKGVCDSSRDIAVVGDRLFTDILMANLMGSSGVWISTGVIQSNSWIVNFEKDVYRTVKSRNT